MELYDPDEDGVCKGQMLKMSGTMRSCYSCKLLLTQVLINTSSEPPGSVDYYYFPSRKGNTTKNLKTRTNMLEHGLSTANIDANV